MQDDRIQGILFSKQDLIDLSQYSQRQKVFNKMQSTKKAMHNLHIRARIIKQYNSSFRKNNDSHAVLVRTKNKDDGIEALVERLKIKSD